MPFTTRWQEIVYCTTRENKCFLAVTHDFFLTGGFEKTIFLLTGHKVCFIALSVDKKSVFPLVGKSIFQPPSGKKSKTRENIYFP